jgi:pyridoxine 5-phosphate synthase
MLTLTSENSINYWLFNLQLFQSNPCRQNQRTASPDHSSVLSSLVSDADLLPFLSSSYFCAMTKLSVNINKIATLRNSRGGNNPDLIKTALDIERFGADGITVHPRPDERHIRYADVTELKKVIRTELNIEGNCREQKFVDLVLQTRPAQVTLVPDALGQLTSDHGWNTVEYKYYLIDMIRIFKEAGIRVSIFVDPVIEMVEGAAATGTDRIELYTEGYASHYFQNKEMAVAPYVAAAQKATALGLGLNAGHDLSLDNLAYFSRQIPELDEVSIGHALICDALYYGLENTVQLYQRQLHTH